MSHSPAPWALAPACVVVAADGRRVCNVPVRLDPSDFDDCRLIVAAPDLLQICQRIMERGYVSPSIAEEREDHDALAAAIARATGAGA